MTPITIPSRATFWGRLGRIPRVGDVVEEPDHGIRLVVDSMDRLRIATVLVSPISKKISEPTKPVEKA